MKITSLLVGVLLLFALPSCDRDNRQTNDIEDESGKADQKTPLKLIEYLVGEWEMASTPNASGTENQQESPGEKITFTTEARYIVYDGNQKVDSGAYRMNEQLNNLYLESESDETPREYEIKLEPRQMTLTPSLTDSGQAGTKYVYQRVGPASIPPAKQDMAEGQNE